jgi:hypothetical protein
MSFVGPRPRAWHATGRNLRCVRLELQMLKSFCYNVELSVEKC